MVEEQINNEIQNLVVQARSKFNELEGEYNKFGELRTELQNKTQGIRNFHSNAENKSNSIDSLLNDATNKTQELESTKNKINEIKQEIDTYYQKFVELKTQLDNESDGMEANFDWVKEKKDEVNKKYEEVIKIHTNSDNLKKQIEEYKNETENIKQKSEEFKNSIGETLDLVTASSLVNAFKNRKDEIGKSAKFWKWFLVISLLLLAGVIIFIYYIQAKYNGFQDWRQWYRYLFATPIGYLVYLSSKNYNLERDLLEKYSYKAVLSTSLKSYIKLLRDYFPNKEENILKFTLESTDRIYKEPFSDKDKKRKFIFGIKSIFNVGIEDTEVKEMTKEIIDNKKDKE
ncbi:hypothetical protein KKF32_03070 [Patescibacteria group bacterium]|nr:hypothetical protein [Patescibacteria group bacterium]